MRVFRYFFLHKPTALKNSHYLRSLVQSSLHSLVQSEPRLLTDAQSDHKLLLRQFHSPADLIRSQSQSISENHDLHRYFESAHQNLVVWAAAGAELSFIHQEHSLRYHQNNSLATRITRNFKSIHWPLKRPPIQLVFYCDSPHLKMATV